MKDQFKKTVADIKLKERLKRQHDFIKENSLGRLKVYDSSYTVKWMKKLKLDKL